MGKVLSSSHQGRKIGRKLKMATDLALMECVLSFTSTERYGRTSRPMRVSATRESTNAYEIKIYKLKS